MPAPAELRGQVGDQALVTGIDGRDAAEALVVRSDLEQTLIRDSATARRVAHERQDVVRAVRATVGQQHDRVVGIHTWHFQSSFRPRADSVGPLASPTQRQIVRKTQQISIFPRHTAPPCTHKLTLLTLLVTQS